MVAVRFFLPGGVAMQMFSVCGACADLDDGVLWRRHSQTRWCLFTPAADPG